MVWCTTVDVTAAGSTAERRGSPVGAARQKENADERDDLREKEI